MKSALILTAGFFLGWFSAHHEIKTECLRQHGFYIGSLDFSCQPQAKRVGQ